MELTPRIKQILKYLLDAGHPVTYGEIAGDLGVSNRTVLREMEYISSILDTYGLKLQKKNKEGSYIEGDGEAKERLKAALGTSDDKDMSDKDRRRSMLKLELLRNRSPQKLFYYSRMFDVSEATISNDIEAIVPWFQECGLEVIRRTGYGILLSGGEKGYRNAMQRLVHENLTHEKLPALGENIYGLLNEETISKVGETLEGIDEPYLQLLTNNAYLGLMIHLAVAVQRIVEGEYVETPEHDFSYEEGYDIAKKIATALEEAFDVSLPEAEVNNILLHVKGAKLHYTKDAAVKSGIEAEELLSIIDSMIDTFDIGFASWLKYDEEFINGLMVHLEPALYRMKNGMAIHNPLLNELRAEYPDMFDYCEVAARVLTERTGLVPNEAEIGYLVMHFGAAREKYEIKNRRSRNVSIGVVCASGFGVARLMLAKIESNFADRDITLNAYGSDEINENVIARTDFFISSFNVDFLHADYVLISPLVTRRDLVQISGKIDEYSAMPLKRQTNDFTRQLDSINDIILNVKGIISRYHHLTVANDLSAAELIRIFASDAAKSQKAAAVLASDINARESIMTQIFPELGIALFHCKSKAVSESYVLTASAEGGFSGKDLSGIRSAVFMVIPDDTFRKENSKMLGLISSALIEDESFLEAVKSGEEQEIRAQTQKILKDYFVQQLNDM